MEVGKVSDIFFIAERSGSSEHGRKHDTSTCSGFRLENSGS
jgi:hypothetical protein